MTLGSLAQVESALARAGLERLRSTLLSAFRLCLHPSEEIGSAARPGSSRVGGGPGLPEEIAWPSNASRPLSFIAQLRLSDFDAGSIGLPTRGMLSLFFDSVAQPAVARSPDVCVLHFDEDDLAVRAAPVDGGGVPETDTFEERAIAFEPMWTVRLDPGIPGWVEAAELLDPRSEPLSYVGGHAYPIQEPMEQSCADAMGSAAPAWRLLLQLDSDPLAGFSWGSGSGRLYVWIEHDRLRSRDFSRVIAIIQDS